MSVYSLCSTALRTAAPLPQVSPILFSRYLSSAGFHFHTEQDGDDAEETLPGLPKELTVEVLESEEYLTFAVGVMTLSGIVLKLDSLLLAVKELVGESYSLPAKMYMRRDRGEHSSSYYPRSRPMSQSGTPLLEKREA